MTWGTCGTDAEPPGRPCTCILPLYLASDHHKCLRMYDRQPLTLKSRTGHFCTIYPANYLGLPNQQNISGLDQCLLVDKAGLCLPAGKSTYQAQRFRRPEGLRHVRPKLNY